MLDESTKIELSQSLSINKDKIDIIIENIFDNISKILLKGTPFYIENIGTISIEDLDYDEDATRQSKKVRRIVFYANEEKAYYSTQTLALNIAIEHHEDEQKIREIVCSMFSFISNTLTKENKISIKNFGDFYINNDITFLPSFYLDYLINPYFNLIKDTKTITKIETSLDDNDKESVVENKITESIIEEDIIESLDDYSDIIDSQKSNKISSDNTEEDLIEEVIEVLDDVEEENNNKNTENIILKYDDIFNKHANEPFYRKPQKRSEGYEINIKEKTEDNNENKKKSYKNVVLKQKKERSWILVIISIAAILIVISTIILLFYKNVVQEPIHAFNAIHKTFENNRPKQYQNNNMYDIAEFYFIRKNSKYKTYILNRDMYYWEISQMVYGETIYWPFIYALNGDKTNIGDNDAFLLKQNTTINIAELKINDIVLLFVGMDKDVAQTLAELYFSLYSKFYAIGYDSKAMDMLTIAAEIDRSILEQKKYEIPTQIYDTISANVDYKRR